MLAYSDFNEYMNKLCVYYNTNSRGRQINYDERLFNPFPADFFKWTCQISIFGTVNYQF